MIQRMQTLFILLVVIASIAIFFFPLAGIYSEQYTYKFFIYEMRNMVPGEASIFSKWTVVPLVILDILVGVLSIITIFYYKNRLMQLRLVRMSIFFTIILVVLIFFVYANLIERNMFVSPDYLGEAGIYFPLICLIFLILANRLIARDERLVRSIDRLR